MVTDAQDKQAQLLSSDAGHFSMIKWVAESDHYHYHNHMVLQVFLLLTMLRALHMADYITAMNGMDKYCNSCGRSGHTYEASVQDSAASCPSSLRCDTA